MHALSTLFAKDGYADCMCACAFLHHMLPYLTALT